ncbi:efflux transporter outer membrane subunit [bacterium]|nr:efflux transporter outer membrane subunit [bacterium]
MSKLIKTISLITLIILVSGCSFWQRSHNPQMEPLPDHYTHSIKEGEFDTDPWWLAFNDSLLNQLMDQVFNHNLTLEAAVARLDQYRALNTSSRSSWFPSISTQGSYQKNGNVGDNPPLSSATTPDEIYNVKLTAAWELDLFGKLAANRAASYNDLSASRADLQAVILSISSQAVRTYYQIVELKMQTALLNDMILSFEEYLELVEKRYQRGTVSSLDVYQAQVNLAGAKSRLAQLETAVVSAQNALSVLTGNYPGEGLEVEKTELPSEITTLSPGIPSELLKRRPDVISAYYKMRAADSRWAEAVASRLPSFSLTGTVGGSSQELKDALDPEAMVWNAIGSLTVPLFAGGRLKANADRTEAAYKASAANYMETVLNGFRDVENALSKNQQQKVVVNELTTQTEAAANSLRIATDRYLRGVSTYLTVTNAQTAYLNAHSSLISARRELIDAQINLVTALGGDWTTDIAEELQTGNK